MVGSTFTLFGLAHSFVVHFLCVDKNWKAIAVPVLVSNSHSDSASGFYLAKLADGIEIRYNK